MDRAKALTSAATLLRWMIALLYLVTGALKLADPAAFSTTVDNYRLLPPAFSYSLGLYVPWLEIIGGGALLIPGWRHAGWFLAMLLGAGFSVFVISAWARGLDVNCGCWGGATGEKVGATSALRGVGLFVAGALGWWKTRQASVPPKPTATSVR